MSFSDSLYERLAVSVYVGVLMFLMAASLVTSLAACLGYYQIFILYLATLVVLIALPLGTPAWGAKFSKYAMTAYTRRATLTVKLEDPTMFSPDKQYFVGYEPHSVFPFGLPQVFSDAGPYRANLKSISLLATSVVDWCPILRHLFHWLNGVPASRDNVHKILDRGGTIAVVPGGVAECAYMEPGKDVVFLKSRRGFVRVALQHGVPLVPVFCFGQSNAYSYIRLWPPFLPRWLYDKLVRKLLFCPMLIYGVWGTALPYRAHLHMAIGKAIELPHVPDPDPELVKQYLQLFIDGMQALYDKHKTEAGYPDSKLIVM